MSEEVTNYCAIGDRVEITDENGTKGIVIDVDTITNEGGIEPRAKVYQKEDTTIDQLYLNKETWICEGNLTMLDPKENLLYKNLINK